MKEKAAEDGDNLDAVPTTHPSGQLPFKFGCALQEIVQANFHDVPSAESSANSL